MTDDKYAVADEQVDDSATEGSSVRDRVESEIDPVAESNPASADGATLAQPGAEDLERTES